MAKIRRSDLAPQEPPAAPHAALYDQDNDTDFAPTAPDGPEKKRGSLAYTLAMLFFGEAKGLNPAFHAGLGLHLLSVLRETQEAIRCKGA